MTHEQFTYWLQGFIELNDGKMPSEVQWAAITQHLATVFNKITPKVPSLSDYIRDQQATPFLHSATC